MKYGWSILLISFVTVAPETAQPQTPQPVRLRADSTFETRVARIAQELDTQRRVQSRMGQALYELQIKLKEASDEPERTANERAFRIIVTQLREVAAQQMALRKRLELVCAAEQRPTGYLGVVTNGRVKISRVGDGPDVFTYAGHPVVVSVEPGSPAEKAGIRSRDVLVAIGGRDLRASDVIPADLLRPGLRVPVKVLRGANTQVLVVRVAPRPESFDVEPCPFVDATIASAFTPSPNEYSWSYAIADSSESGPRRIIVGPMLPVPRPRASTEAVTARAPQPPLPASPGPFAAPFVTGAAIAGLQLTPMNPELGATFGTDEGLLVLNVAQGTPAQRAGLRGGDVLLTANDQDLTSYRVLQREISLAADRTDHEVKLLIVRQRERKTITLTW